MKNQFKWEYYSAPFSEETVAGVTRLLTTVWPIGNLLSDELRVESRNKWDGIVTCNRGERTLGAAVFSTEKILYGNKQSRRTCFIWQSIRTGGIARTVKIILKLALNLHRLRCRKCPAKEPKVFRPISRVVKYDYCLKASVLRGTVHML